MCFRGVHPHSLTPSLRIARDQMSSPCFEQMPRDSVMLETIAATTTEMAEACKSKPAMQDLPMTLGGSKTGENKHASAYYYVHLSNIQGTGCTAKVRILLHYTSNYFECTYLHMSVRTYIQDLPPQTFHTPRGIHGL